jgi:acetate kinase
LNAGSSSLKWKLFEIETASVIANGLIEEIAEHRSVFHLHYQGRDRESEQVIPDHREAFSLLFQTFEREKIIDIDRDLDAIGHRVVHGGEKFFKPTLIDVKTLEQLKTLNRLAPLHNPANVLGIELTFGHTPQIPNIAVFDTAFHHDMPEHAFLYALPMALYKEFHIRRYGFHGTSHHYVAQEAAKALNAPLETLNLITLHLGNGASACAIKNGKSVDTSMGFTPLEGLIMGSRCGDLDPAIVLYLIEKLHLTAQETDTLLNTESGLKGICNENDLRTIVQRRGNGDTQAALALEMFTYRIKKYIGSYLAVLGRVDAIIFTGGIGEHAALIRSMVLADLGEAFGIALDTELNTHESHTAYAIHQENSRIKLFVIPTDEEFAIAKECANLIDNGKID